MATERKINLTTIIAALGLFFSFCGGMYVIFGGVASVETTLATHTNQILNVQTVTNQTQQDILNIKDKLGDTNQKLDFICGQLNIQTNVSKNKSK